MAADLCPRVRSAKLDDAPAVAALLGELGYPSSDEQARARLRAAADASVVLVAEVGSEVVGFLAAQSAPYFPDGSVLMRITALAVAAPQRRRGVGKILIDAVTRLAAEQGCAAVELTTAERRADAHRFYESLGFANVSRRYLRRLRREEGK